MVLAGVCLRVWRGAGGGSTAAASAFSDEVAVTCMLAIDRMAWQTATVNDCSLRVTCRPSPAQGTGGGVPAAQRGGLAGAG